jgi:hypothetical protein
MMLSGLVGMLGGCVDGAGPAPGAADEPMVERTIVKLLPGGTSEARTEQVSAAQIRREIAAREARIAGVPQGSDGTGEVEQELASLDSCPDWRAMWIFDSENHMLGTGLFSHEICFIKTSSDPPVCADLRNYARVCFPGGGCQHWAGDTGNWIGSYWAGVDDGYFSDILGAAQGGFNPFQSLDNAETQLSSANHLCFNNHP